MPAALGYARVSLTKMVEKGLSLEAQEEAIQRYYEYRFAAADPKPTWGGVYVDGGVSAFKVAMSQRKAGGELCRRLQRGDHLIMMKLDRAFRRVADGAVQINKWTDWGVMVHILNLQVDTSTPNGRLMVNLMLALAEHERDIISERTKAVLEYRRRHGLLNNGHAGFGFKSVGQGKERRRVPDPEERKVMAFIVECIENRKLTYSQVYFLFLQQGIKNKRGKPWARQTIWAAYRRELLLRANESCPPSAPSESREPETGS